MLVSLHSDEAVGARAEKHGISEQHPHFESVGGDDSQIGMGYSYRRIGPSQQALWAAAGFTEPGTINTQAENAVRGDGNTP